MPHCNRSSTGSVRCRLEWRPSRWLLLVLVAMTVLAPVAVLASEMPRGAAWPLSLLAVLHGLRLACREARRPRCTFVFAGDGAAVLRDGIAVSDVDVSWRGPLAFVAWRAADGRRCRLSWWPDTLPAAARRELRLAAPRQRGAQPVPSMAP